MSSTLLNARRARTQGYQVLSGRLLKVTMTGLGGKIYQFKKVDKGDMLRTGEP